MKKEVIECLYKYKEYDLEEHRCIICGIIQNIHRHHIDYIADITIPLCASCHMKAHNTGIKDIPAPSDPLKGTLTAESDYHLRRSVIDSHKRGHKEALDKLTEIDIVRAHHTDFITKFKRMVGGINDIEGTFGHYENEYRNYINTSIEDRIRYNVKVPNLNKKDCSKLTSAYSTLLDSLNKLITVYDDIEEEAFLVKNNKYNNEQEDNSC